MEKKFSKREQNKSQHRADILRAAERLFLEKGFDSTSIDDVARAAGLTKRTLYQYFISKEDLFYAVALKGGLMLMERYEKAFEVSGNALEKIRRGNEAYLQFYREYLGLFRILNYQPSNQQNNDASPNYRELGVLNAGRMMHYVKLVEEGRADGSINPELDTKKAVFFAFFAAFSLLYTASSTDKAIWGMLGMDADDFLQFGFALISDALEKR